MVSGYNRLLLTTHHSPFTTHSSPLMSDATPYHPRCKNLYCKSMIVYGEGFENDPDYQMGLVDFWCNRTSKNQGPDGDSVALDVCSDPERACYEEF